MSKHLGDYDASAVIYGKFTTYRPSTGASFTLGGTPALSVYKDNSTTQSTTGVTLTADFDSVTGLNHFAIDTSADGTFYAAGSFFYIVITTGTVDSVSVVGSVVASFTIRKDSSLKPTTAARTLDVSAGGEAGVDWANVGSPTTAVNLSATNIDVDQVVASVSGATGSVTAGVTVTTNNDKTGYGLSATAVQAIWDALTTALTTVGSIGKKLADWTIGTAQTGDSFARLGAPAGASVSADIAAAKADTAAIKAKTDNLPAAPAAVGDIPTAAENATAVLTTAMTESYRADGATGTLAQMQYEIIGHLGESSIVSTTKTIKKVDGTTTAATFTLDSDTAPTSITRAT